MGRLGAIAIALVAGCSFEHGAVPADASPDVAGPSCADVVCDAHATCGADLTCSCITGYAGDGMSCAAIDPCATSNGNCPAACEMTGPGTSQCYAPATCADVGAHTTLTNDSSVTLYVNMDPAKPWTAFCHGGLEYLTLPAGSAANYGQYSATTKSPGTSVRTKYSRVRLDPSNLKVDISDQTFAMSMGMLMHDPNNNPNTPVTSMPLGVAMDCHTSGGSTGVAKIDLTGVPFTVSSTWSNGGNSSTGQAVTAGQVTTVTGGGNCGWTAPTGSPNNPFNTFANAKLVTLTYAP